MGRKLAVVGTTLAFLASCTLPPPVYPSLDAEAACRGLCAVLEDHRCPGWEGNPGPDERYGTPDDVSCVDQCLRSVELAPWMQDKASCGAAADGCDGVDRCMEEF